MVNQRQVALLHLGAGRLTMHLGATTHTVSKRPVGDAFAVLHLHDSQRVFDGVAVARDRIVFARGEQTSSIWLAEAQ